MKQNRSSFTSTTVCALRCTNTEGARSAGDSRRCTGSSQHWIWPQNRNHDQAKNHLKDNFKLYPIVLIDWDGDSLGPQLSSRSAVLRALGHSKLETSICWPHRAGGQDDSPDSTRNTRRESELKVSLSDASRPQTVEH